ncbi:MAG: DNA-processing protein DprA [Anaerolineae bacterium]
MEAGERSGALITADCTLEQGRELFAVPGKIVARKSRGTNRLIQEGGAKLILSVEDIYGRVEVNHHRRAPRGARDPPRE